MKQKFALITGGGAGLGRALAIGCAQRGYNLVLVSLPGSHLDSLCAYLESHYHITAYGLELDLCAKGSVEEVVSFIEDREIPINFLINNAGLGHTRVFSDMSSADISRILVLNMEVVTHLTHRLIPLLQENAPAHILNVSSFACFYSLPYKNCYAASKAYVKQFSLSLRFELEEHGISVSVLCPSGIITNPTFYQICIKGNWITRQSFMDPEDVAEYALDKTLAGKDLIIPGRVNRIIYYASAFFPKVLRKYLAQKMMKPVLKTQAKSERMVSAA